MRPLQPAASASLDVMPKSLAHLRSPRVCMSADHHQPRAALGSRHNFAVLASQVRYNRGGLYATFGSRHDPTD